MIFWLYILATGVTTYLAIKYVWPDRASFNLRLPSRMDLWIWGVGMGMTMTFIDMLIRRLAHGSRVELNEGWYLELVFLPVIQFIVAATAEEPFFRGLLWGYLKRLGRPDWAILVVQALLFFAAHSYYAVPGQYAYWFSTLVAGFLFGLSAWKTRSILPSMIAHALSNGLMQTFMPSR